MALYNSLSSLQALTQPQPRPYAGSIGLASQPTTGAVMNAPKPVAPSLNMNVPPPPVQGGNINVPQQPSAPAGQVATRPSIGGAINVPPPAPSPALNQRVTGGAEAAAGISPAPSNNSMGMNPAALPPPPTSTAMQAPPQPQQQVPQAPQSWMRPTPRMEQPPQPPPQAAPQAQASLEQQALNGGGVDNKQQISNFMTALHNGGAGTNNTFAQGAPPPGQPPVGNMVNQVGPQATQQFNQGPAPQQYYGAPDTPQGNSDWSASGWQPAYNGPAANNPYLNNAGGFLGFGNQPIGGAPKQIDGTQGGLRGQLADLAPKQIDGSQVGLRGQMAGLMSDETQKENIGDASGKLNEFMASIGAHSYTYKNPEIDGQGTYTTPMAQELQKTELGKQAVIETPRGLMVDYARLGGVNLAAVSVVHREQQKLAAQVERLRGELRKRRG